MTKKRKFGVAAIVVAALAVGVAWSFFGTGVGRHQAVEVVGGQIAIPVAELSTGEAQFFKLTEGGKKISFFAVKGSDGVIHTAFDTCDACYQAKKGYVQQGEYMKCTNCNQRFAIAKIGPHAIGGCNPSYLPSAITGENVLFKAEDVTAGARYF